MKNYLLLIIIALSSCQVDNEVKIHFNRANIIQSDTIQIPIPEKYGQGIRLNWQYQIIENKLCSIEVDIYRIPGIPNRPKTIKKLLIEFIFFFKLKK